ncbi:unnamed protein product [Albugo candida]|uniref:Peptidase A1 domain-containing protein n=1 Tax=Albugo candida TaxID=65357 RepID=A0A024GKP6_9STRA|nr:unnamed protein product [Albugo candida]|eukprot:CCI47309.1 unnamed protein product [Albugo candida]
MLSNITRLPPPMNHRISPHTISLLPNICMETPLHVKANTISVSLSKIDKATFLTLLPCGHKSKEGDVNSSKERFAVEFLTPQLETEKNKIFSFEFEHDAARLYFLPVEALARFEVSYHKASAITKDNAHQMLRPLKASIGMFGKEKEQMVAFDYGNLDTLIPKEVFSDFQKDLKENQMNFFHADHNRVLPCAEVNFNALPPITITIDNDFKYKFDPRDYIIANDKECRMGIKENPNEQDEWIIGARFAKTYVTAIKLSENAGADNSIEFGFFRKKGIFRLPSMEVKRLAGEMKST